jgi:hypothetical protein
MAAPPPPPELVDDVIPEILLRLPPDEPKWLFRAALACKPWLRTISDPTFLHRYRAFHGAPPLLGLIDREPLIDRVPRFVATTAVPAFSFLIPTISAWPTVSACALDCRHGRALIRKIENGRQRYFVCDPVTGDRHRVPRPDVGTQWMVYDAAAIFCAVTGCQHLDCHGGPFYVVFMFRNCLLARTTMSATIYSSEMGAWSVPATLEGIPALEGIHDNKAYGRGALIGDEIYFMLSGDAGITKYDWRKNCLSVVNRPPSAAYSGGVTLMVMEDCSLGLAGIEHTRIYLWSRRVSSKKNALWSRRVSSVKNAEWVQCRVIDLEKMMPMANPRDRAQVVGFAEVVGVIFITTGVGLFMMELKSGRVKKIGKPRRNISILPYMSFYTPGIVIALVYILAPFIFICSFHMLA